MKSIAVIPPVLLCLAHAAFAGNTPAGNSPSRATGTLEEFSSIRYERGSLVVEDLRDGSGYTASIGEAGNPSELEDGARVSLPLGRLSFFQSGKQAVSFRPLDGGERGFLVRKSSGGRAVQFRLLIDEDGSLAYGPAQEMKEKAPKVF